MMTECSLGTDVYEWLFLQKGQYGSRSTRSLNTMVTYLGLLAVDLSSSANS